MSGKVMGAVLDRGPAKRTLKLGLAAIADNGDDFGFAVLSIQTIAVKVSCDARTAMRVVKALELERWITVHRRVLGGKGSVYCIDVQRLGVTQDVKSRRSPLWAEIRRVLRRKGVDLDAAAPAAPAATPDSGDKMSPEMVAPKPFLAAESGDKTIQSQVTKRAESGDKTCIPLLKNRIEPLNNPDNPPTPLAGGVALDARSGPAANPKPGNATAQARRVLRERGLSDQRLEPVIAKALTLAIDTGGGTAAGWADTMIANHASYVADVGLLRFACGARKFFQSSLWRGEGWPYDGKLVEARRRASVGRLNARGGGDDREAARLAEEQAFHVALDGVAGVLARRERGELLTDMELAAVIRHREKHSESRRL